MLISPRSYSVRPWGYELILLPPVVRSTTQEGGEPALDYLDFDGPWVRNKINPLGRTSNRDRSRLLTMPACRHLTCAGKDRRPLDSFD